MKALTMLVLLFAACSSDDESGAPEDDAGSGGIGGSGGAAASGGSDTGGGADSGNDAGELCAERSGGALITFQVVDETLTVWVTDDAFIDEAIRLREAGEQRIPVFDTLIDGQDCDAQWSFHPDPESVSFADFTIELCDGLPSHIEGDKSYWIGTVGSYCPWSAQVVAVDDRR